MGFPGTYQAIRRLTLETALETSTAKDIARKAGIRLGSTGLGSADIWGTFSQVNDATYGYLSDYVGGVDAYYFPDDAERMSRLSDMSGRSLARLLVTVTLAGEAGSSIGIASDQITFSNPIQLPLDVVGLHVSEWAGMTLTSPEVFSRWVVGNPSMVAGSFGVGLMQWQVR